MTASFSILQLAILIGLAILVHELGHFFAARLCGIKVIQFSIGFGPRLFGFHWGGTDYTLCAVPLGGFVRLSGEEWGEGKRLKHHDLMAKPAWMRIFVYLSGVIMNVGLAFLLFTGRSLVGEELPDYPAVLGSLQAGTQAEKAGLRKGDRIEAVDGHKVRNWHELAEAIGAAEAGEPLRLQVRRKSGNLSVSLPGEGDLGLRPFVAPVVGEVAPMYPARKAGIMPGDRILAVNGDPVEEWMDLAALIGETQEGESIKLRVRRDDDELVLPVTPRTDPIEKRAIIGITPKPPGMLTRKFPLSEAALLAAARVQGLTVAIVRTVAQVVTGRVKFRDALGGPVMIARIGYEKARKGIWDLLEFAAVLNVHLMAINLLPLPMLDGGMIVISAFEGLRRRRLSVQTYQTLGMLGWALILSIFLLATYYDLVR